MMLMTRRACRPFVWAVLLAGLVATGARAENASGTEVHIVDLNLRAAIEKAVGVQPGHAIRASDLERLVALDLSGSAYDVLELTGLQHAVNLERLNLRGNRVVDIGALAELPRLSLIELDDNDVADISPLIANAGIGLGDQVFLSGNPLSSASIAGSIPELREKGAFVSYRDDHGGTIRGATALPFPGQVGGGIDHARDTDYFRFTVSSAVDVAIFTTGGATRGDLVSGTGAVLASGTDGGAFENFLIRRDLQPGPYYIRVAGARGPYTIHVSDGMEVPFASRSLRSRVAQVLGDAARDGITSTSLASLTGTVDARSRAIRDLGGLEFAVNLIGLRLSGNRLENLTPLSSLVSLVELELERASVTDVAALVANPGLDAGDKLFLAGNTLSDDAVNVGIPELERRGVFVGLADDHGNDRNAASPIALGGTVSASIYPARDRDIFRFELATATDVVIYATGDVDTVGVLSDAQGRQLAVYDANGPENRIAQALDAGDYYLQVRAADEAIRGPYVVHVHEDPNVGILPDPNLRAVVAGVLNKPPEAEITADDLGAMTTLEAAGASIRNLAGLELAVNLTHVDLSRNRVVDIEPLSHLIALKELRLADNDISDFGPLLMNPGLGYGDLVLLQGNLLSRAANAQVADLIAKGVSVVFADEHGNSPSRATALALGDSQAASIHRAADLDYFRLTVPRSREVAVFTTGDVDLLGTLTDVGGRQLASDDDRGAAKNFLLRATLSPADYFIRVDGYADSLGTYMIHAVVDEQIEVPDDQLRARVEDASSVEEGDPIRTSHLAPLQVFEATSARISDLTGLDAAVNLRHLSLRGNRIADLDALSDMTSLSELDLEGNQAFDVAALVENAGLGPGDKVILAGNPLNQAAREEQLRALDERGVFVGFVDDHGDRTGTATRLAPGGTVAGTLSTLDDADVFHLEIADPTDVVIYTTGPTDTAGLLAGAGSSRAAADSDSGLGDNFTIRRHLNTGVHYVTVSGSNGFAGVGPYTLHATVAPTAAPENITVLRDGSSLVVTWDPVPADLAGGTITRYRAIATPSDGSDPIVCTATPDANGCTIVGLADGVDYTVTVHAVNAVGFGPIGTFAAPPEEIVADVPLTNFWRGWRLSLAVPPPEDDVVAD